MVGDNVGNVLGYTGNDFPAARSLKVKSNADAAGPVTTAARVIPRTLELSDAWKQVAVELDVTDTCPVCSRRGRACRVPRAASRSLPGRRPHLLQFELRMARRRRPEGSVQG